ncbi:DNA polymerase III subunit beta [compost metagenome]
MRPALATKDYVPALTHILFDGGRATAYNDISAISVRCDLDLGRCVPGADFSGALASFGGSEVLVQLSKGDALSVKCGRGTLRLQTLPAADFPYEPPGSGGAEFALTTDILRGVERCLLNVGADSGHPAQSGVTLDADGGIAVLYSTDGATISRFVTSTKIKLPGDAPVILPKFFCEQVVSMARAFPEAEAFLVLHDGALQADFGAEATVFTRVPLDVTPLDFPRTFAKHARGGKDGMFDIPDLFDGALQRALLVLGQEKLKTARVHLAKGNLNLSAGSGSSQSEDDMKYDWDDADPTEPMRVDAALLARAAKVCTRMSFTESVTAFADADGDFTHIVAHVAKV